MVAVMVKELEKWRVVFKLRLREFGVIELGIVNIHRYFAPCVQRRKKFRF